MDEELRAEMIECQAQIRRWTTEQKHIVDSLTLDAQRTLEGDKGKDAITRTPFPPFPPVFTRRARQTHTMVLGTDRIVLPHRRKSCPEEGRVASNTLCR